MLIRIATAADLEGWVELRASLWPDGAIDAHRNEVRAALASDDDDKVALLAVDDAGRICGFAEAALRYDYVNGCETSPVAFLEGICIRPEHRGRGVGRRLCSAVEAWGRDRGCSELASDALLANSASHAFHGAIGFEETERVVYFRKAL